MANAPLITAVDYNGTIVKVWWQASSDPSVVGYNITILYDPQTPVYTASVQGQGTAFGQIALDSYQLDSNIIYYVQVTTQWNSGPGQGEASQLTPLITALPEIQTVYYDGSNLNFRWLPSNQAVQGYILKALIGGTTYTQQVSSPSAQAGMIPAENLQGSNIGTAACQVTVSAVGNVGSNDDAANSVTASAPFLALPNPFPALTVTGAAYVAGKGILVSWNPVQATASTPNLASYQLLVTSQQDATHYSQSINDLATGNTVLQIDQPLNPGQKYDFSLMALAATGLGNSVAPMPVITTPSQLVSVVYNNSASPNTVDLTWTESNDSLCTGYMLEVYATSGTATYYSQTVTGASSTNGSVPVQTALSPSQTWAAQVSAIGAAGTVSALGAPVAVFPSQVQITAVKSDGDMATCLWTPVTGLKVSEHAGYSVTMTPSGGGASVSTFVKGIGQSSAELPVPDPGSVYLARVTVVDGITSGPPSQSVQAITVAPVGFKVVTDAVSNTSTLTWSTVNGANNYWLNFKPGGAPVQAQTNSYVIPGSVLFPGSPLSVTVQAAGVSNNANVSGPYSVSFAIPVEAPVLDSADYDGATANVNWAGVPGASGYVASVLQNDGTATTSVGTITVGSSNRNARIAFTATSGNTYQAVVQVQTEGQNTGPVSEALPLFSSSYFVSNVAASTCYPFVYPATRIGTVLAADSAKTGEPITLYLPDIGAGTALADLPLTQGAFTLAANTDPSKSSYPYTLTISNTVTTQSSNPWYFGAIAPAPSPAAIRDGIRSDYVNFLSKAEQAKVVPWGILCLQQALGRLLPQTFAELLYYNFGLSFPDANAGISLGSVDLRPGMILRVAINPYQMLPGQQVSSWNNGFLGGPEIDYEVGSLLNNQGNLWSVGFDSFIGQLVANGGLMVSPPAINRANSQEAGVGEAADLYYAGFAGPFFRLFAPSTLLSPTGNIGSIKTSENFVIAPAQTYADLMSTTNTLNASGTNQLAYFRGRTSLKVCMRVTVNDNDIVVPVGTTLANLLERLGQLTPAVNLPVGDVLVERSLGGAVLNPGSKVAPMSYRVRLDWVAANPDLYGPNWTALSMPLLSGDRVTVG